MKKIIVTPLQKECERLDILISSKFLGNSDPIPSDRLHVASEWLSADITSSLMRADDMEAAWEEILEIIENSPMASEVKQSINLKRVKREAEVRSDWAEALRNVKNGSDLSGIIDYGFSKADLANLAKLHKANKFRRKIEELLTDCNFHAECGMLMSKQYDAFMMN